NDTETSKVHSISNLYWITKEDMTAPSGFATSHYYARFIVPQDLRNYVLSFNSSGTPIHKIIINSPPTLDIEVIQESLSDTEPIYLEDDLYELEINNPLILKGCVLDNDEYIVEDEVYSYLYQEALDGETVYSLNIISPFEDNSFIDKTQFAIYYLNNQLKKIPLYVSFIEPAFIETNILNQTLIPEINYVDNTFLLNIHWNNEIEYDTNLLISYKVVKGRPISPLSFSSFDSYGNDREENLIEIPFVKYDMISKNWITESVFTETFFIDKKLLFKEVEGTNTTTIFNIQGPKF
ncbi:unnamed protein product, partial [marine sediment metagenome]